MKKRIIIAVGVTALSLMSAFGGCQSDKRTDASKRQKTQEEQSASEHITTAVYLLEDDGNEMFVQLEPEMLFSGTIPEDEIYDENGSKISREDLKNGDVLEITGNGIIAESYPAQYHGIYKMRRIEKENAEYIEKYQGLLEQFIVKEDPKEIPYLDLSYRQPEAVVTAAVRTTGGYTWSYETKDGQTETIAADSPHILQWDRIDEMKISENTKMELLFSKMPETVTVAEYDGSQKKETGDISTVSEDAEEVEAKKNQEGNFEITAVPDKIYLVEAKWDNGEAQYGFWTKPLPAVR